MIMGDTFRELLPVKREKLPILKCLQILKKVL